MKGVAVKAWGNDRLVCHLHQCPFFNSHNSHTPSNFFLSNIFMSCLLPMSQRRMEGRDAVSYLDKCVVWIPLWKHLFDLAQTRWNCVPSASEVRTVVTRYWCQIHCARKPNYYFCCYEMWNSLTVNLKNRHIFPLGKVSFKKRLVVTHHGKHMKYK